MRKPFRRRVSLVSERREGTGIVRKSTEPRTLTEAMDKNRGAVSEKLEMAPPKIALMIRES